MTEPVFLTALAMVGTTAVLAVRAIASAFSGRGAARDDVARLKDRVERQAAALEDAQASLAEQSAQLAEVQERLDFAERILAQARQRSELSPGERDG